MFILDGVARAGESNSRSSLHARIFTHRQRGAKSEKATSLSYSKSRETRSLQPQSADGQTWEKANEIDRHNKTTSVKKERYTDETYHQVLLWWHSTKWAY
jgi:hypothetical protein